VPWLRVLVLAFALVHATGVTERVLETVCGDDCEERDCRGACPPVCPTCHCLARAPASLAAPVAVLAAPPRRLLRVAPASVGDAPASPDPREILHVPIARAV